MIYARIRCFWYALIVGAVLSRIATAQAEVPSAIEAQNTNMDTLSTLSAKLDVSQDEVQSAQLVASGVEVLSASKMLSLEEELVFVTHVVNYCSRFPKRAGDLKNAIDLLKKRHAGDLYALAKLMRVDAVGALNIDNDRKRESVLLHDAISNIKHLQVDIALLELELTSQAAESSLSQASGADAAKARAGALENYRKVLEFPLMEQPYFSRVDDFKKCYTRAALRLVELTPVTELRMISFYPFALDEIKRAFPQKATQLSASPPEVRRFQESMTAWVKLTIQEQPKDSPIRAHFEAVLHYLTPK